MTDEERAEIAELQKLIADAPDFAAIDEVNVGTLRALLAEVERLREIDRTMNKIVDAARDELAVKIEENERLRTALQEALRYHLYGERHVGSAWIEDAKHLLGFGEGGQP